MPELSRHEVLLYLIAIRLPVAATEIVFHALEIQRKLDDAEKPTDAVEALARLKLTRMLKKLDTEELPEILGMKKSAIPSLMKAWRSHESPKEAKKHFRLILKSHLKNHEGRLFRPAEILAASLKEFCQDTVI